MRDFYYHYHCRHNLILFFVFVFVSKFIVRVVFFFFFSNFNAFCIVWWVKKKLSAPHYPLSIMKCPVLVFEMSDPYIWGMRTVWAGFSAWRDSMGHWLLSMPKHLSIYCRSFFLNFLSGHCICDWLFSLNWYTFKQVLTLYAWLPFPTGLLVTNSRLYNVSFQNFMLGQCSSNFHSWLLCN
jgi:hypothetical protein